MLPPKYVGEAISLPIILSKYLRRLCGRILSSPTTIIGKYKRSGGSKPPPYVVRMFFLCIYCEFRICNTNAVGLCPYPYFISPIRTSRLRVGSFLIQITVRSGTRPDARPRGKHRRRWGAGRQACSGGYAPRCGGRYRRCGKDPARGESSGRPPQCWRPRSR